KARTIDSYYRGVDKPDATDEDLFMALGASVLLESFLFYSGFFLPLWLCGQGQMVASADIIKKIVADESIHGIFVGLIAQDVFQKLPNKEEVKAKYLEVLHDLFENEMKYTEEEYTEIGLTAEVKEYVREYANKAVMKLDYNTVYDMT